MGATARSTAVRATPGAYLGPLSEREKEVLHQLAAGLRRAEIAIALGITESTVHFHLRRLRAKLQARTLAHAVSLGYRKGVLP